MGNDFQQSSSNFIDALLHLYIFALLIFKLKHYNHNKKEDVNVHIPGAGQGE